MNIFAAYVDASTGWNNMRDKEILFLFKNYPSKTDINKALDQFSKDNGWKDSKLKFALKQVPEILKLDIIDNKASTLIKSMASQAPIFPKKTIERT